MQSDIAKLFARPEVTAYFAAWEAREKAPRDTCIVCWCEYPRGAKHKCRELVDPRNAK